MAKNGSKTPVTHTSRPLPKTPMKNTAPATKGKK